MLIASDDRDRSTYNFKLVDVSLNTIPYKLTICSTVNARKRNEDSFLFWVDKNNNFLSVVCDGLGGHPNGEKASQTVIDVFQSMINAGNLSVIDENIKDKLEEAIASASKAIKSSEDSRATTATIAVKFGNKIITLNIGDSNTKLIIKTPDFPTKILVTRRDGIGAWVANVIGSNSIPELNYQEWTLVDSYPWRLITQSDGLDPVNDTTFINTSSDDIGFEIKAATKKQSPSTDNCTYICVSSSDY